MGESISACGTGISDEEENGSLERRVLYSGPLSHHCGPTDFSHLSPTLHNKSHPSTSSAWVLEPFKEEGSKQLGAPLEPNPVKTQQRVLRHSHADPRSLLSNCSLSEGPTTDVPALTGLEGGIRRGFPTTWRGVASSVLAIPGKLG